MITDQKNTYIYGWVMTKQPNTKGSKWTMAVSVSFEIKNKRHPLWIIHTDHLKDYTIIWGVMSNESRQEGLILRPPRKAT